MDKIYSLDDVSSIGNLPDWIARLLEDNKVHTERPTSLLALLLHCMMIECGFSPKYDGSQTFQLCDKSDNVYRFKYTLARDRGEPKQNFILLCTTVASVFMTTGILYFTLLPIAVFREGIFLESYFFSPVLQYVYLLPLSRMC